MLANMLQVGLVWGGVSLVVLIVLSVFVYAGSTRRHGSSGVLSFDDPEVVSLPNERRGSARSGQMSSTKTTHSQNGADESAGAEPAITHQVTTDSGSLNRLLAGVQLPCGLERLHPDDEDEAVRMAFVTVAQEPRMVAVSVVDELERLGMEVEPLSYTEARAHRDGFELAVTIYLEPRRVIRARRTAFPTAPLDAVVVEFTRV